MQRWLLVTGVACLVLGLTYPWWGKVLHVLWGLPGNIVIKRGSLQLYFPLTLCLLISLVVTLVSWIVRK